MTDTDDAPRRRRGRKLKPDSERRHHAVTCRLTDGEVEHIDALRPVGVSRGEWLRRLALSREAPSVVPPVNRQLWSSLGRLVGNLNQHQRAINTGAVTSSVTASDLDALRDAVERLRTDLLGGEDEGEG